MRNRPIPQLSEVDKAFVRELVIFEDATTLVFNKPSGLPVQTRGNRGRNLDHLLWAFARSNGKRPRLVHRIDTGTSGLVVAAKTKPAAVALSEAFAERRVEKTYLCLVSGDLPSENQGQIHAPLKPLESRPPRTQVSEAGQAAITDWQILNRAGDKALIQAKPVTGRMHQIRAHLAHLSCPILGDQTYGGKPAERLMLHAERLTIPQTEQEPMQFHAPAPTDFMTIQVQFGL